MNPQPAQLQVQAHTDVNSHQQSLANNCLEGRWLILARVLWCATFVFSFAYFIVSMVANTFDPVLTILLFAVTSVWFAISGVLFWRKSNDRVILLFSLALMLVGGVWLAPFPAAILPLPLIWELPFDTMLFLAQAAFLISYLFPDGRFVPHWTRWLALAWIVVSLDGNLPSFLSALSAWNSLFSLSIYRIIEVAFLGSLAFAQIYRYRRVATPMQRQQTKWVVYALAIVLVGGSAGLLEFNVISYYFPALALPYQLAQLLSSLTTLLLPVLIPLSIGIASTSKDTTVQIWDPTDGSHVFIYRGHQDEVYAASWSPNGKRIASCSKDKTVQVWDAADGGHLFTYRGHKDAIILVAWSPDGKRLASGGGILIEDGKLHDDTVQVWDATDGSLVFTYRGHTDQVFTLAWSPDGKYLASAGADMTVQVWDAVDGKHEFTYTKHTDQVLGVAWSPNSARIVSTSVDKTAQVWDALEGGHVFVYNGHTNWVVTPAWSPDGTRIATTSYDDTVQIWSPG